MKITKRLIISVSILIFINVIANGQTAVKKFFPKVVASSIMYRESGIPAYYYRNYIEINSGSGQNRLKGSVIPFYYNDFYFNQKVRNSVVSVGLMQKSIKNGNLNSYLFRMNTFKNNGFLPLALPVIYMNQGKSELKVNLGPLSLYENRTHGSILTNSNFNKITSEFSKNDHSYSRLIKTVYYKTPHLVDIHIDELPDPPKMRDGKYNDRKQTRETISDIFRQDSPTLPKKIEKVELQKRPWVFSGSENIQFSQAYLKNWAKGGQNSVALLSDLRVKAVYTQGKTQWENRVIHKLGIISSQGSLSRVNDDLIDLNSKYGISANKHWFYSFLFNFKSQFFYGYASSDAMKLKPISGFMAPGYFTLAAGMDYKKGKNFTLLLSPVTSKLTVVLDTAKINQKRYNIPTGKRSVLLTGGSLVNDYSLQLNKEIKLTSSLNVFYDYFEKDNKVQAEWDMIIDMRINVFLSTRIVTNLRYYENESNKLQMRETMGISFRYNF